MKSIQRARTYYIVTFMDAEIAEQGNLSKSGVVDVFSFGDRTFSRLKMRND